MKSKVHHIALNVERIEWYTDFFQTVFGMTVCKVSGEMPNRKVWFAEGIQLNECQNCIFQGNLCDHFAIEVDDTSECMEVALKMGCVTLPAGNHWMELPNKMKVELIQRKS